MRKPTDKEKRGRSAFFGLVRNVLAALLVVVVLSLQPFAIRSAHAASCGLLGARVSCWLVAAMAARARRDAGCDALIARQPFALPACQFSKVCAGRARAARTCRAPAAHATLPPPAASARSPRTPGSNKVKVAPIPVRPGARLPPSSPALLQRNFGPAAPLGSAPHALLAACAPPQVLLAGAGYFGAKAGVPEARVNATLGTVGRALLFPNKWWVLSRDKRAPAADKGARAAWRKTRAALDSTLQATDKSLSRHTLVFTGSALVVLGAIGALLVSGAELLALAGALILFNGARSSGLEAQPELYVLAVIAALMLSCSEAGRPAGADAKRKSKRQRPSDGEKRPRPSDEKQPRSSDKAAAEK